MTHPMSTPWLDWRPIREEPREYEVILYASEDGAVWTGNHPEGCARGMWREGAGGTSSSLHEPVMWARIPLPQS